MINVLSYSRLYCVWFPLLPKTVMRVFRNWSFLVDTNVVFPTLARKSTCNYCCFHREGRSHGLSISCPACYRFGCQGTSVLDCNIVDYRTNEALSMLRQRIHWLTRKLRDAMKLFWRTCAHRPFLCARIHWNLYLLSTSNIDPIQGNAQVPGHSYQPLPKTGQGNWWYTFVQSWRLPRYVSILGLLLAGARAFSWLDYTALVRGG